MPLALAFGVQSGMGAAAGLYGAIVLGIFAAAFGGTAYRIDGDFQKTVPNSPREGNTLYFYIQTILSF